MINPWKLLGVHRQSTDEEIRNAFIELAKEHHPDKGGDVNTFQKINRAYAYIKNKKARTDLINNFLYSNKKCGDCEGKGAKSKGFSTKVHTACSACGGSGLIISTKEKDNEGTTIIYGTTSSGGKGRNNKRRS